MNSPYLVSMKQKRFDQCSAQMAEEEKRCQLDVKEINQLINSPYPIHDWTPNMFVTYGVLVLLCILSLFISWMTDIWSIFIVVLLLDVLAILLADSIFVSKRNVSFNAMIVQREEAFKKRCYELELQRDDQIDADKKNYLKKVENAQLKYGGSAVISPVVTWLCYQLIQKIKSADKRQFITHIQATFRYRVDNNKIGILEYRPHANTYSEGGVYWFYEHSFLDLPDLFHQIGCSLALAKLVEFELLKRMSDSGHSTNGVCIALENEDNTVTISFTAPNPYYIHPVDLDKQN